MASTFSFKQSCLFTLHSSGLLSAAVCIMMSGLMLLSKSPTAALLVSSKDWYSKFPLGSLLSPLPVATTRKPVLVRFNVRCWPKKPLAPVIKIFSIGLLLRFVCSFVLQHNTILLQLVIKCPITTILTQ